jgi:hypothetical protein
VSLDSGGEAVAGVQNDLELSSPLEFASTAAGEPDCTVDPAIGKLGAFRVFGCDRGGNCESLRASCFPWMTSIRSRCELYRCRITIDAGAVSGSYPMLLTNPGAADPKGNALFATGIAGPRRGQRRERAAGAGGRRGYPEGSFTPISVRLTGSVRRGDGDPTASPLAGLSTSPAPLRTSRRA